MSYQSYWSYDPKNAHTICIPEHVVCLGSIRILDTIRISEYRSPGETRETPEDRVKRIIQYFTSLGATLELIESHLSRYRDQIEEDCWVYYHEHPKYHLEQEIVTRFKNSRFFGSPPTETKYNDDSPDINRTTPALDQISFVDFAIEIGIRYEIATHWERKFARRQMTLTPKLYIFALLHGLNTWCGNRACTCHDDGFLLNSDDQSKCFVFRRYSFIREYEYPPDLYRLDTDDFLIYGKRDRHDFRDYNTDFDGLLTILRDDTLFEDIMIERVTRHCLLYPHLDTVYQLLT